MTTSQLEPSLGDYLRKRLMPVEGAIPQLPGIEMYGNSIPAGTVAATFLSTLIFTRYNIAAYSPRPQTVQRISGASSQRSDSEKLD